MATSTELRLNKNQHKPKNTKSKQDDKAIYLAMEGVMDYLRNKFGKDLAKGLYDIEFRKTIATSDMINIIKSNGLRKNDFELAHNDREIKPDGGAIFLIKRNDNSYQKPVVIAEVKRQGTNDERLKEGKNKQSEGNAIERLGKNLSGIRAMLNHDDITPFACFCWGCDFSHDYILSKLTMMNDFYPINKIYVRKKDGDSNKNKFSPISIFARELQWTKDEMFETLKEIAETSLRYYLY